MRDEVTLYSDAVLRIRRGGRCARLSDAAIGSGARGFSLRALCRWLRRMSRSIKNASTCRAEITPRLVRRAISVRDGSCGRRRGRRRDRKHADVSSGATRGIGNSHHDEQCQRYQRPPHHSPPDLLDRRNHALLPPREVPLRARLGFRAISSSERMHRESTEVTRRNALSYRILRNAYNHFAALSFQMPFTMSDA